MKNKLLIGILCFLIVIISISIASENKEKIVINEFYTGKAVDYADIGFNISPENHREYFQKGNDIFLDKVKEVINASMEVEVNDDRKFKKIYKEFISLQNYTQEIDEENGGEYIQTIQELIKNNYRGDCDDFALFLYIIAKKKGLEVRYITGMRFFGGHAWIQIEENGRWVEYDSTNNEICDDNCVSKYFEVISWI